MIFALSQAASPSGSLPVYPGRIDTALLKATVPDIVHTIAFICGPQAMIGDMKALLTAFGVPPAQIRYEVFEAAIAAAAGTKETVAERVAVEAAVGATFADRQRAGGGRSAGAGGGLQMHCLPTDVTVPVARGQSLLEAAEAGGVDVPSLCRAGVCGTCRVRVTTGDVDCESTTLDASDLGQGYVLACVSMARSNCTMEV